MIIKIIIIIINNKKNCPKAASLHYTKEIMKDYSGLKGLNTKINKKCIT